MKVPSIEVGKQLLVGAWEPKSLGKGVDMIRGSSIWALRQLLELNEFNIIKKKFLPIEMVTSIRDEWI